MKVPEFLNKWEFKFVRKGKNVRFFSVSFIGINQVMAFGVPMPMSLVFAKALNDKKEIEYHLALQSPMKYEVAGPIELKDFESKMREFSLRMQKNG